MTTNQATASFAEDAAIVAATVALDLPRPDEPADPIAAADPARHVLEVDALGRARIVGHGHGIANDGICRTIERAARTFVNSGETMPPGEYWCDVSPDGNFEIGGRLS